MLLVYSIAGVTMFMLAKPISTLGLLFCPESTLVHKWTWW